MAAGVHLGARLSTVVLELYENEVQGARPDIFNPMRLRVSPQRISALELRFHDLTVREMVADRRPRNDVGDESRMRVQLLPVARLKHSLDYPHVAVLELHVLHPGIDLYRVERLRVACSCHEEGTACTDRHHQELDSIHHIHLSALRLA